MKTRKIVALLLAVVMVFAMSASAFAIDTGDTYSSYTFDDLKLKVQVSMATEGLTISGNGRSATIAADTGRDIPQAFSLILSDSTGKDFVQSEYTITTTRAAIFDFDNSGTQDAKYGYGVVELYGDLTEITIKRSGYSGQCMINVPTPTAQRAGTGLVAFLPAAGQFVNEGANSSGWGGAFISIAIIVGVAGAWLSFTMLPAETTSEMAERHLLPESWGKLNSKGAPQMSLLLVGACIQVFLIVLMFSEDAYNFAFSMCTVSIVITWAFIALYQIKFSAKEDKNAAQIAIGVIALAFQVVGVLYNGWSFLLLTCVGYIPGFFVYAKARKDRGYALTKGEKVGMGVVSALGVAALALVGMGVIGI